MGYYDYYFNPGLFGGIILIAYLTVAMLLGLTFYILRSVGLQTIAKRRGLNHSWLAWLPVGREWIIGSVSDQYQYVVKGENRNKRKLLLGLSIGTGACSAAAAVPLVLMAVRLAAAEGILSDSAMASIMMGPVLTALVMACVSGAMGIVLYVFKQMAMYDLYRSCDPHNAVAYLVLAIVFGVLEPVFLMVLRKKERGMPPRKERPTVEEPVYREPWEM